MWIVLRSARCRSPSGAHPRSFIARYRIKEACHRRPRYHLQDGQLLAPPEAAAPPNVTLTSGGEGLFTLLTVDPDAPDPANPTRRSILHYLVTNVPAGGAASEGTEVRHATGRQEGRVAEGRSTWHPSQLPHHKHWVHASVQVTPWAGPRPPSGTHRYVFLAYEQPGDELLEVSSGG